MLTDLTHAPVGVPLTISRIEGGAFAARMQRLGLFEGMRLTRLNEAAVFGPARVRGLKGDAVLSAWLAGQVVIHLDDDRRIPLLECRPRESGHVEGITGQTVVEESLRELGIVEGDRITFLRRVPPMNYKCSVNGKPGAMMDESLAAHLLGDTADGPAQFSSVGVGEDFIVRRILPGENAEAAVASLHITPGSTLQLASVSVSPDVRFSGDTPIPCVTRDGLRLYFRKRDAAGIFVEADNA